MPQSSPCKCWVFTLNNYTEEEVTTLNELLDGEDVKYAIYQKETGDSGTRHLQGYFELARKKRLQPVKNWLGIDRIHLEKRRGSRDQARDYCRKLDSRDENTVPTEFGVWREEGQSDKLALVCQAIRDGQKADEYAEISPTDFVRNYRGLAVYASLQGKPYEADDTRGVWFYGKPGVGKTHAARTRYEGAYIKQQNKWFDNYQGEETIFIDDFDMVGKCLGHYIKIWADKWPCVGEIKGGRVNLEHKHLVITSNYLPKEIWEDDEPLFEAINRRFKVIKVTMDGNVRRFTEMT